MVYALSAHYHVLYGVVQKHTNICIKILIDFEFFSLTHLLSSKLAKKVTVKDPTTCTTNAFLHYFVKYYCHGFRIIINAVAHLRCGGIFNQCTANVLPNVPEKVL